MKLLTCNIKLQKKVKLCAKGSNKFKFGIKLKQRKSYYCQGFIQTLTDLRLPEVKTQS